MFGARLPFRRRHLGGRGCRTRAFGRARIGLGAVGHQPLVRVTRPSGGRSSRCPGCRPSPDGEKGKGFVEFETFHRAYLASLRSLMTGPVYRNAPRGFPSVERLGVRYRVRDASQRIPMVPARRLNIVFNFAEALWYLSGRDDLDFIAYYAP